LDHKVPASLDLLNRDRLRAVGIENVDHVDRVDQWVDLLVVAA